MATPYLRQPYRLIPARPGLGPPRATATLAWGVNLHAAETGELHESLSATSLDSPFGGRPDLESVVRTEQHGTGYDDGDLLIVTRTLTRAGHGLGEVPAAAVTPPTEQEAAAVHTALDHLGYTGPRDIRLFLTVGYS